MNKLITNNCEECGSDIITVSNGHHTCTGCGFVSEDVVLEEQVFYSYENETSSYLSDRMIGVCVQVISLEYSKIIDM